MKRLSTAILTLLLLLASATVLQVSAQRTAPKPKAETAIASGKMPEFKGGPEALNTLLKQHLQPLQTTDQPETDVSMILKFTVNPDGSVTEVDAIQIGGSMRKAKTTGNSRQHLDAELSKGKRLLEAATAALKATSGQWVLPKQNKNAFTLALHTAQIANEAPTYELKPYTDPKANKVYKQAEQMPQFKGGQDAMIQAINSNLQVPEEARKENLSARVITSFIVEKDGSISNIRLTDTKFKKMFGPGEELDYMDASSFNIQNKTILARLSEAAVNALKATSGNWEPGIEKGKAVRVEMLLPFSFSSTNPPQATLDTNVAVAPGHQLTGSKLDKPYSYVEDMPRYKAGDAALKEFITANITYPATANKKEGLVFLSFIVEKDGQLSNFKVEKSLTPELDSEALRVLRLTRSDWQPGKQGGVPVRVKFTVPVRFKLN